MARRVQLRAATQLACLQNTTGVRHRIGPWRCGKQTTLPTSPQARLRRRLSDILTAKQKPGNSSYEWLRKRGQVNYLAGNKGAIGFLGCDKRITPPPYPPNSHLCFRDRSIRSLTKVDDGQHNAYCQQGPIKLEHHIYCLPLGP